MILRRDFLAMTAGAVAARTVLPIAARAEQSAQLAPKGLAHPDAGLLHLGQMLDTAAAYEQEAWDAILPGQDDDDHPAVVRANEACEATGDIAEAIIAIPALSYVGVAVKVRAVNWCRSNEPFVWVNFSEVGHPSTHASLMASLMNDLAAMGSAAT